MYHEWEGPQAPPIGLPMTPSVALRALHSQIQSYRTREIVNPDVDLFVHFDGPILPPRTGRRRPVGDAVFETVASYASMVAGREGLLITNVNGTPYIQIDETGFLTRAMFALEHALALDLSRNYPETPLHNRELAARSTLALASFWCDRPKLTGLGEENAHPLLGTRPEDAIGSVLYDFAQAALADPAADLGPIPVIQLGDSDSA